MRQLILSALCILNLAIILPLPGKFSYAYNENGRIASGLIHLRTGDYSTFHVNPPLPDMVGALPAFLADNYCPTLGDLGMSHFGRMEYKAGDVWTKKNPDHFRWITYGRYCMLGFVLLGTVTIFLFVRNLYGDNAAVFASLFWIFSPYILGCGCLVCPDVPSAAFAIMSIFTFLKWLHQSTMHEALQAGLVLGVAELCKFTLLIFYPLYVILWLVFLFPNYRSKCFNQAKQIFLMFAVSLLVINMGYLFEDTGKPLRDFRFQTSLFSGVETLKDVPNGGGNRFKDSMLGYLPMLLPANYIQGIDTQRLDFERGLPSYLRGEWSDHGWWHYYFYALLIKTPLGTIGLLLLAIFCTFFVKECNASWRDEMVVLLPGIVLLTFVSSQTGFSIHSRYIIPALPFFFIWISKVGRVISWKCPILTGLISFLLAWSVASSLWVYPHSISYFNELAAILPTPEDKNYPRSPTSRKTFWQKAKYALNAGPRNGPRHLLDSNIDWGQDLFNLERWCRSHPEVKDIKVAYWGSYPLELSDVPSTGMPDTNSPQPGWYALSVNYIYDREKQYRYFLNFEPVTTAGYSIYIYHISPEEANRVRKEIGLPMLDAVNVQLHQEKSVEKEEAENPDFESNLEVKQQLPIDESSEK